MRLDSGARRRPVAWGLVAAALYLAVAVLSVASGLVAGRPLYDGIPLAPYRWVNPPAARLNDNQKPEPIEVVTEFKASGYPEDSATTPDTQATVIISEPLDQNEYLPTGDNQNFRYRIMPLDPATVGPRPRGRFFDGNAYLVEAFYPTGRPVGTSRFDIILTYAVHATDIRRWSGSDWEPLASPSPERDQYQIYSPSPVLGVFVATGDGDIPMDASTKKSRPELVLTAIGLGASITLGMGLLARRRKGVRAPARNERTKARGPQGGPHSGKPVASTRVHRRLGGLPLHSLKCRRSELLGTGV